MSLNAVGTRCAVDIIKSHFPFGGYIHERCRARDLAQAIPLSSDANRCDDGVRRCACSDASLLPERDSTDDFGRIV
jgi:hypothetical protein